MAFLSSADRERLVAAVRAAEKETSGEIVVYLTRKVKDDIDVVARDFFLEHGLQNTAARNGVLVLVAYGDRQLAILGDEGIDEKVPDDFWASTVTIMTERFKEGDYVGGLEAGIAEIGEQLSAYFPYQEDDVNELSDQIHLDEEEP